MISHKWHRFDRINSKAHSPLRTWEVSVLDLWNHGSNHITFKVHPHGINMCHTELNIQVRTTQTYNFFWCLRYLFCSISFCGSGSSQINHGFMHRLKVLTAIYNRKPFSNNQLEDKYQKGETHHLLRLIHDYAHYITWITLTPAHYNWI